MVNKTIVFDMLGDIYTMPIDGGDAIAVVRPLADAQRIAFAAQQPRLRGVQADLDGDLR